MTLNFDESTNFAIGSMGVQYFLESWTPVVYSSYTEQQQPYKLRHTDNIFTDYLHVNIIVSRFEKFVR